MTPYYADLSKRLFELAHLLSEAAEIVEAYEAVEDDRAYWRNKTNQLQAEAIRFSDDMTFGLLAVALKDSTPELSQRIADRIAASESLKDKRQERTQEGLP